MCIYGFSFAFQSTDPDYDEHREHKITSGIFTHACACLPVPLCMIMHHLYP